MAALRISLKWQQTTCKTARRSQCSQELLKGETLCPRISENGKGQNLSACLSNEDGFFRVQGDLGGHVTTCLQQHVNLSAALPGPAWLPGVSVCWVESQVNWAWRNTGTHDWERKTQGQSTVPLPCSSFQVGIRLLLPCPVPLELNTVTRA